MCAGYVARRRAEIAAEDRGQDEGLAGFVPQVREPGAEAEVDFGDVTVELAGQLTRCFLFAFRLSCSGKGVHWVYASQAQEAFLEGHVTAFEAAGGVPFRQIRYDNLSPAVAKVLAGRNRTETARWLSFRAFYGFRLQILPPANEGQMIARIWRGSAPQATAGDYQRYYETEVSRHLQGVEGFCGARLLRQGDGQEVMFTSVTFFTSIDAVRGFARHGPSAVILQVQEPR